MEAVEKDEKWDLVSPKGRKVIHTVKARDLWVKLLTARVETGEPYLLFIDNVNRHIPAHHKELGLKVKTSNLCSEITLATGPDHLGKERTAVCCLSSLNLETYDEWVNEPRFIEDVMRFLDNVLQDFIDNAPSSMERAKYSAMRERSVGLGVMGFHSYLQSKLIPFESVIAKVWNKKMFAHIRAGADAASRKLAEERGACPDAAEVGVMERFTNKLAIAPTASISIIAGNSSPGIEPYAANSFTQKTLSGSFNVRNKHLTKLLDEYDMNNEDVWSSISSREGSVQHLDFLSTEEKAAFKTAPEIDQRWIIEHAADRTPFVCQAQSINLFLTPNIHKRDLHLLHFYAWKKGVKSLYYCRSTSLQRADKVSHKVDGTGLQLEMSLIKKAAPVMYKGGNYEECLACQ
jgi:ribonucleoside-diphosphate reductase alpha chain